MTGFDTTLSDGAYMWRVNERNDAGVTTGTVWQFSIAISSSAEEMNIIIPEHLTVGPAYPNPFNASVTIPFVLESPPKMTIEVYDLLGRHIASLFHGNISAGMHQVFWSADHVGSGIYFVKFCRESELELVKIVTLK